MIDVTQASLILTIISVVLGILLLAGSLAFFGVFVQREFPPEVAKKEEDVPAKDAALQTRRSAAYRLGLLVLLGLTVLTAIEFGVAVTWASAVVLLLIGLFKAGLIVQYFMHVTRIWSEEAH